MRRAVFIQAIHSGSIEGPGMQNCNMPKFTCLVLCAVAVSLGSVCAVEEEDVHPEEFIALAEECAKLHGHTEREVDQALRKGDASKIKPCFWGCAFTKAGFLNGQGQYDLDSGLTKIKRFMRDSRGRAELEAVARQCESVKDKAVSDGEAGCERGALAAACFIEKLHIGEPH